MNMYISMHLQNDRYILWCVHVLISGLIKKYPTAVIVFMTLLQRECEYISNSNDVGSRSIAERLKNF